MMNQTARIGIVQQVREEQGQVRGTPLEVLQVGKRTSIVLNTVGMANSNTALFWQSRWHPPHPTDQLLRIAVVVPLLLFLFLLRLVVPHRQHVRLHIVHSARFHLNRPFPMPSKPSNANPFISPHPVPSTPTHPTPDRLHFGRNGTSRCGSAANGCCAQRSGREGPAILKLMCALQNSAQSAKSTKAACKMPLRFSTASFHQSPLPTFRLQISTFRKHFGDVASDGEQNIGKIQAN